jgi:hypothetical protein
MSTQISKQTTRRSQSPKTKSSPPKLGEDEKAADLENYILNPASDLYVKRTGAKGKRLVREEAGEELEPESKGLTLLERFVALVDAFEEVGGLTQEQISAVVQSLDKGIVPQNFPAKYGGKKSKKSGGGSISGYNLFCREERPKVVEEFPDLTPQNVMKEMGARWSALKESDPDAAEEFNNRAPKSPKTAKAPTRTRGYTLFCKAQRPILTKNDPEAKGPEINSQLGEDWAELGEDGQKKFKAEAKEENADFEERLAEFNEAHDIDPSTPKAFSAAEKKKAAQPEKYILNPKSNKHVLKTSSVGKSLARSVSASPKKRSPKKRSPRNRKRAPLPDDDNELLVE